MSYPLSCNGIIYFVIKSQKYIHIKKKKIAVIFTRI